MREHVSEFAPATLVPRAGLLATVRNRRGVISAVRPYDGETGRLHLVHVEYKDDRAPASERLPWELESGRHLLEPNALPDPAGEAMPPADFDALLGNPPGTSQSPFPRSSSRASIHSTAPMASRRRFAPVADPTPVRWVADTRAEYKVESPSTGGQGELFE